jgi:hypothetical protein
LDSVYEKCLGPARERKSHERRQALRVRRDSPVNVWVGCQLQAAHLGQWQPPLVVGESLLNAADKYQRFEEHGHGQRQGVSYCGVERDQCFQARINHGGFQNGRPAGRQAERANAFAVNLRVGCQKSNRGLNIRHPLVNVNAKSLPGTFAVAAQVNRERRYSTGSQHFAQFKIVLFEFARAMANDHHRCRGFSPGVEKNPDHFISLGLQPYGFSRCFHNLS